MFMLGGGIQQWRGFDPTKDVTPHDKNQTKDVTPTISRNPVIPRVTAR